MSSHDLPSSVGLMPLYCRWTVTIFARKDHETVASQDKDTNHFVEQQRYLQVMSWYT